MIHANVAEVKSKLSYYLRLATSGEKVIICDRNKPVAELVPVPGPRQVDLAVRESAFGMYSGGMSEAELQEALRPMTLSYERDAPNPLSEEGYATFLALRGIGKQAFEAVGGGENFLKREREEFGGL